MRRLVVLALLMLPLPAASQTSPALVDQGGTGLGSGRKSGGQRQHEQAQNHQTLHAISILVLLVVEGVTYAQPG